MPLVICEWWAYDDAGWSMHRVAAASRIECHAIASRSIGGGEPYSFGVIEHDESPAPEHPGRIVSSLMPHDGEEPTWRVRDDGPQPFYREGGAGRFYRQMKVGGD